MINDDLASPPSDGLPFSTISIFAICSLMSGVVAGTIAGYFSPNISYVMMPVTVGIVSGMILTPFIVRNKIHKLRQALLFTMITTISLWLAYKYMHYQLDITWVTDRRGTGITGFVNFMLFSLQLGIGIYFPDRSYFHILNMPMTFLYWLFEFSFTALAVSSLPIWYARRPFCAAENRWMNGEWIGSVSPKKINRFKEGVKTGNFEQAIELIEHDSKIMGRLEVYTEICGGREVLICSDPNTRKYWEVLEITRSQYQLLMQKRAENQVSDQT